MASITQIGDTLYLGVWLTRRVCLTVCGVESRALCVHRSRKMLPTVAAAADRPRAAGGATIHHACTASAAPVCAPTMPSIFPPPTAELYAFIQPPGLGRQRRPGQPRRRRGCQATGGRLHPSTPRSAEEGRRDPRGRLLRSEWCVQGREDATGGAGCWKRCQGAAPGRDTRAAEIRCETLNHTKRVYRMLKRCNGLYMPRTPPCLTSMYICC